jgi:hypothetical protein
MKEALSFSETSALTRATRRNISEDTNLHRRRFMRHVGPEFSPIFDDIPSYIPEGRNLIVEYEFFNRSFYSK